MIDAHQWDNVEIDVDKIHMSTLERVAKLFNEVAPEFEFGFPTLDELEEWREKYWIAVSPAEWPDRLRQTTGFTEKDGLVWFRGHVVAARPKHIDQKMRRAEMNAQEKRWNDSTQRSGRDAKTGLSIEDQEEVIEKVKVKRRGRKPKNSF